ncbi:hypothetical protein ARMGADRAFT_1167841 [Armillaria gallica]|uniref:40S ribosomal protein S6 n=1 Tax=Armillaria gallica TaxID=47427 RepID=A0A2H3DJ39_ARMGA|nr:hypothetical protein ARMGADRAFT_1167841 [Armillaria gallica]
MGERKRKSVQGCIVGPDIPVLSLVIVKQGDVEIPGLTDTILPKHLGPKQATNVHKMFNLSKEDDVRKHVICREVKSRKKENSYRHLRSVMRRKLEHQKEQKSEYDALIAKRASEKKAKVAAIQAPHHKDNHCLNFDDYLCDTTRAWRCDPGCIYAMMNYCNHRLLSSADNVQFN